MPFDPDRVVRNRVLFGDETALDALPMRQPDTGRKIRKDAHVAASLICTLPKESRACVIQPVGMADAHMAERMQRNRHRADTIGTPTTSNTASRLIVRCPYSA